MFLQNDFFAIYTSSLFCGLFFGADDGFNATVTAESFEEEREDFEDLSKAFDCVATAESLEDERETDLADFSKAFDCILVEFVLGTFEADLLQPLVEDTVDTLLEDL